MQSDPRPPKLLQVLDTNSASINFDPSGSDIRGVIKFKLRLLCERLRTKGLCCDSLTLLSTCVLGGLLYAKPSGFVNVCQPRNNSLPRPPFGSIQLNQSPVQPPLYIDHS